MVYSIASFRNLGKVVSIKSLNVQLFSHSSNCCNDDYDVDVDVDVDHIIVAIM
jgi:hypothetical protein